VRKDQLSVEQVVFDANARCNQENVIEQLKNGVQAMRMPSARLIHRIRSGTAWLTRTRRQDTVTE